MTAVRYALTAASVLVLLKDTYKSKTVHCNGHYEKL